MEIVGCMDALLMRVPGDRRGEAYGNDIYVFGLILNSS